MQENITVSRNKPTIKSMDYDFLKAEGIKRIQELAGDIWTDYNEHDPGVTILEVLCYALTDLGYRLSFDMKDLLAGNPEDQISDEFNFFTPRQILHNNPVTLKDYRKLLMDVSISIDRSILGSEFAVNDDGDQIRDEQDLEKDTEIIGIKNAWVSISNESEHDVFAETSESRLLYTPPAIGSKDPLDVKVLYDAVLEFSESSILGDLNLDNLERSFPAFHPHIANYILNPDPNREIDFINPYDQVLFDRLKEMNDEELQDVQDQTRGLLNLNIAVKVEFPRWDETSLNWNRYSAIKNSIQAANLRFSNLPDNLNIRYILDPNEGPGKNNILLASGDGGLKDRPVPFIDYITTRLNCLILGENDRSLLGRYQKKVLAILDILNKAEQRLHDHRNLCEDFFSFSALKVEEILVCADIDLEINANVESVEAEIYYLLDRFLSPTVNFYSLKGIRTLDIDVRTYNVQSIDKQAGIITVNSRISEGFEVGDVVTLTGRANDPLVFTVSLVSPNPLIDSYTNIFVEEDLSSLIEIEGGEVFKGTLDDENSRKTEDIFIGPALENGFIDDDELDLADRKSVINASDIINLIMDVSGVATVRKLELANFPQDENPDIPTRSVKWCLKLAVDQNYVPRLSTSKSRLTYFKDGLPFTANKNESESSFLAFKGLERPQKLPNPTIDFEIPQGEYRELTEYLSIQEDLPLTYGVSTDGVPVDGIDDDKKIARSARAKQLKGFLMVFDQLLANYLAQLDHVKDLFSFNPNLKKELASTDLLPEEFNFQVDKTYFSQALFNIVPDADPIYKGFLEDELTDENKEEHIRILQKITEDQKEDFPERRNRFLDHLIARFAEQFTDYALLANRIDGPRASLELIEDKQNFLNLYPDFSANRGKAFNHKSPLFWSVDNTSGLERRSAFLAGIAPAEARNLSFNPKVFVIEQKPNENYVFSLKDGDEILIKGSNEYASISDLHLALENIILHGMCEVNYEIVCEKIDGKRSYALYLYSEEELVASILEAADSKAAIFQRMDKVVELFEKEFFDNPLSNRKNFALPFDNYFTNEVKDEEVNVEERSYKITFDLFANSFNEEDNQKLLSGFLEASESNRGINTLDEIKEAAVENLKNTYWEIVFRGEKEGQYALREYGLSLTDRLGNELARGDVDQINLVLSYIPIEEDENVMEKLTDFQKAVRRLSTFFRNIFFKQEGLHLLEHLLLRPKVNNLWVPAEPEVLRDIPEMDSFIPVEDQIDTSLRISNTHIDINKDLTGLLRFNARITLSVDQIAETYEISTIELINNKTRLILKQEINRELVGRRGVSISYQRLIRVVDINEENLQVKLEVGADLQSIVIGSEITLTNATEDVNYATLRVNSIIDSEEPVLVISEYKVQDKLLPLYIPTPDNEIEGGEDCDDCTLENPYSYIAQVAVTAWPGKFDSIDFRSFFSRSLQLEAPAHVFLNICWIGYDQMELFERKYKKWLLENQRRFPGQPYEDTDITQLRELSKAQNELVDILYELRNVYPVRTLHDCDEGEGTEGAIILNQTALGEI